MADLGDLFLLIVFGGLGAAWFKLSRARELATQEVRRQCERHGLQLLDETVGLRALRIGRNRAGQRVIERGYGFELSIDGNDRQSGRAWMNSNQLLAELDLPTIRWRRAVNDASAPEPAPPVAAGSNVIPLRRLPQDHPRD